MLIYETGHTSNFNCIENMDDIKHKYVARTRKKNNPHSKSTKVENKYIVHNLWPPYRFCKTTTISHNALKFNKSLVQDFSFLINGKTYIVQNNGITSCILPKNTSINS